MACVAACRVSSSFLAHFSLQHAADESACCREGPRHVTLLQLETDVRAAVYLKRGAACLMFACVPALHCWPVVALRVRYPRKGEVALLDLSPLAVFLCLPISLHIIRLVVGRQREAIDMDPLP